MIRRLASGIAGLLAGFLLLATAQAQQPTCPNTSKIVQSNTYTLLNTDLCQWLIFQSTSDNMNISLPAPESAFMPAAGGYKAVVLPFSGQLNINVKTLPSQSTGRLPTVNGLSSVTFVSSASVEVRVGPDNNWYASPASGGSGSGGNVLGGRPVDSTQPIIGQILGWNGTVWIPGFVPASGISQLTGDVVAGPGAGSVAAAVSAIGGFPITLSSAFTTAGIGPITITAPAAANVALPASGTLLNNSLAPGHIHVGNGGGVATDVAPSGDIASISAAGVVTLVGTGIGAGSCTGCNLTYDAKGRLLVAANGSGGGTSALTNAHLFVGSASNVAADQPASGDVTLVNTGAFTVVSVGGKAVSLANSFTTAGNFPLTLTQTGSTNVTLPTSGTLLANALPSGDLFVGSASNVATGVAPSGDISAVSNAGAFTIANLAVSTAKIAGSAVTYPKIQNVAASRLLGNPTGSAAAPAEIPLAGNLTFSGGNLTASGVTSITPGRGISATLISGGSTPITTSGTLYADASVIPFYLGGLVLSNDGSLPNTVIDISAGAATSDDGTALMVLPVFTKTTGAWTLGSGNGCLDTGAVANNTWYHVYVIERTDTGSADALCSTSTTPAFPANYSVKRRLGSIKTNGSAAIIPFLQLGNAFIWVTPVVDVNTSSLSTAAALQTLGSVPPGINVQPICRMAFSNAGAARVVLTSPATGGGAGNGESDQAPDTVDPFTTSPGWDLFQATSTIAQGTKNAECPFLVTDASQHIRARASAASTTLAIVTRGYID